MGIFEAVRAAVDQIEVGDCNLLELPGHTTDFTMLPHILPTGCHVVSHDVAPAFR